MDIGCEPRQERQQTTDHRRQTTDHRPEGWHRSPTFSHAREDGRAREPGGCWSGVRHSSCNIPLHRRFAPMPSPLKGGRKESVVRGLWSVVCRLWSVVCQRAKRSRSGARRSRAITPSPGCVPGPWTSRRTVCRPRWPTLQGCTSSLRASARRHLRARPTRRHRFPHRTQHRAPWSR